MKKLLFTILAVMCCMAMNAQTTFEVGDIKYSVTGEYTVEVVAKDSEYTGSVVIPATVTNPDGGKTYNVTGIGDNAFKNCNKMSSVTIPSGVTSIGYMAFMGCDGLNSITIPEGVTSIGARAFNNTGWYNKQEDGLVYLCNYLLGVKGINTSTNIEITDGTMTIADEALSACRGLTSVTIPESVTSIGNRAFYFCTNLASITFPASVNSIGDEAFHECESLTSITIPKNVTSIGAYAFVNCKGLASITVAEENTIYESPDNCNAIIEKSTHTLLWGCKNTVIPNTVTIINNKAFHMHTGLTSITIPESVTSIGEGAFQSTGLTSVIIGKSVKTIGEDAFRNCTKMEVIYVLATTPPTLGTDAFSMVAKDIPVYVPDVETYTSTSWGGFTNLLKYVDLPTAKEEAIADLQTYINEEKIANAPMEEYESRINAATALNDIPSIVNNIKAEINNYTKFTLGEWKYLLDDNDGEYTIVGGSLTFTDKDIYQCDYDFTANNLTYSRTFEATGVWQAWFVPFDVTVGQMNDAGMEVAQIADVRMGENEQVITAAAKMTNTDAVVKANTPYMVMATKSEVNMTLAGPVIKKSADAELEEHHITIQSPYNTSKIGGIYFEQSNSDWYALSPDGTFIKINGAVLQAQRLWLTIKPRTDSPYVDPSASSEPFIDANELDYFTTPCTDCPSIEVTKGDKTVKLYNPEKVEFKKE